MSSEKKSVGTGGAGSAGSRDRRLCAEASIGKTGNVREGTDHRRPQDLASWVKSPPGCHRPPNLVSSSTLYFFLLSIVALLPSLKLGLPSQLSW